MKIKFFDLAVDESEEIKKFVESHQIIDVKHSAGPDACPIIVLYEEPYAVQVKKFNWTYDEEDVNRFLSSHEVIKVEHFCDEAGDTTAIITYKKDVGDDD